jgi:hypothetical protein
MDDEIHAAHVLPPVPVMMHTFPASLFGTLDPRSGIAMVKPGNDPDETSTDPFRQAFASTDPSS